MPSTVDSCRDWLRRTFGWSNSPESWQERVGLAVVGAMAVVAFLIGRGLSASYRTALWGLVIVALAVVLRRGWLKLFGPVLFYDLVRVARRSRYFLIRGVYGCFLLFLLSWIWFTWYMRSRYMGFRANDMADFAMSFFYTFMCVQFLVVTLLTPAYTASAVADEKERRTLEFLLATDLRNREIVLSKLVSRLANILLLVFVGLPILALLQFLGGVDPGLVMAGFAATGLSVLSLACLSILFSVVVRRTRDAIALTYLSAIAYLILSTSSLGLLAPTGWATFPSTTTWTSPVELQNVVDWFNAGNIIIAVAKVFSGATTVGGVTAGPGGGASIDEVLPVVLRNYALFHGLTALVCAVWAVLRLRAVYLKETYGKPQKASVGLRSWLRPAVGDRPMVWKEVFVESRLRWHWLGRVFVLLLVIASFVPVIFIVAEFIDDTWYSRGQTWRTPWEELAQNMNIWARIVGTKVACLLLLGVAVRAAGSIGGERDRQTFDSLLTSPMDSTTILAGKWVGSLLSVRWGWLWLGAIGGLGLLTTGIHPLAAPLLLVAWFIYAAFLATLGLWFSAVSRTTLRAMLWTLLSAIGIAFGHWLIWACCIPFLLMSSSGPGRGLEELMRWVAQFQFGLTPPLSLGFLAFFGKEFEVNSWDGRNEGLELLGCVVVGLGLYAAATVFLWGATSARFRQLTGRTPFRRPERGGPPSERRLTVGSRDGFAPRRRGPLLIADEAAEVHVQPANDLPPAGPRGAILIEEEFRDDEEKPRPT